jgi:endoglucanase
MRWLLILGLFGLCACGGGGGTKPASSSSVALSSASSVVSSSVSSSSVSSAVNFPSYNTQPLAPDMAGMESTAAELAAQIRIGLNIGNTLEAWGGKSETYWGNPEITREFVAFAKASGFNAIRLPVSWDQYADQASARIEDAWLARVKEVVQYALDEDLYVLVNIHWDGGWLERNVIPETQAEVAARQKAYWEQIATALRDFDQRLLFASANEPHVENAQHLSVLHHYHQVFVDTVRATGGKNAYRVLVVQGPDTDIEKTNQWAMSLPQDSVPDRLMMEVHFYSPYNFTLMEKDESWGNRFFYWGRGFHSTTDTAYNATWGEEDYVDATLALMKEQFADQGIPVILGEYGMGIRDHLTGENLELHLASRAYYLNYVTRQAIANGLLPFYWDTGGLLDRRLNSVKDAQGLEALIDGASASTPYWKMDQ